MNIKDESAEVIDFFTLASAEELAARYKVQADKALQWPGSPASRDIMVAVNMANWREHVKRANALRTKHGMPLVHYDNGRD